MSTTPTMLNILNTMSDIITTQIICIDKLLRNQKEQTTVIDQTIEILDRHQKSLNDVHFQLLLLNKQTPEKANAEEEKEEKVQSPHKERPEVNMQAEGKTIPATTTISPIPKSTTTTPTISAAVTPTKSAIETPTISAITTPTGSAPKSKKQLKEADYYKCKVKNCILLTKDLEIMRRHLDEDHGEDMNPEDIEKVRMESKIARAQIKEWIRKEKELNTAINSVLDESEPVEPPHKKPKSNKN